eukprot:scaffold249656_cov17-Tisochrysis_lutea.AAC.1
MQGGCGGRAAAGCSALHSEGRVKDFRRLFHSSPVTLLCLLALCAPRQGSLGGCTTYRLRLATLPGC